LIALTGSLDKPLYLNLAACGRCNNSFIVKTIRERIQRTQTNTGLDVENKILVVEKIEDLAFEDVSVDRRGFFQALKNMTMTRLGGILDENDAEISRSYSAKIIPLKRDILNNIIHKFSDGSAVTSILKNYAFTVKAGPSCNNCFACIGMCPTGALKIKKDTAGMGLLFNASLCNGCALCRDFCPSGAVFVSAGFSGGNFFEHEICNPNAYVSRAVSGAVTYG
jgi:ferredoxin